MLTVVMLHAGKVIRVFWVITIRAIQSHDCYLATTTLLFTTTLPSMQIYVHISTLYLLKLNCCKLWNIVTIELNITVNDIQQLHTHTHIHTDMHICM